MDAVFFSILVLLAIGGTLWVLYFSGLIIFDNLKGLWGNADLSLYDEWILFIRNFIISCIAVAGWLYVGLMFVNETLWFLTSYFSEVIGIETKLYFSEVIFRFIWNI